MLESQLSQEIGISMGVPCGQDCGAFENLA